MGDRIYNESNIKNLFDSYGVEGSVLQDGAQKLCRTSGQITDKNLDLNNTIFGVQNQLFKAIGKKYNELLKDYKDKSDAINKKLNESTSEAEALKSKGFDIFERNGRQDKGSR